MSTEKVTIDGTCYILAPLNFSQYEASLFDSEGKPLMRMNIGLVVSSSLKNAETSENPSFDRIPAGHVLQMLPVVQKISGLKEKDGQGEAKTEEGQS
jgi:hypothetical protein